MKSSFQTGADKYTAQESASYGTREMLRGSGTFTSASQGIYSQLEDQEPEERMLCTNPICKPWEQKFKVAVKTKGTERNGQDIQRNERQRARTGNTVYETAHATGCLVGTALCGAGHLGARLSPGWTHSYTEAVWRLGSPSPNSAFILHHISL